MSEPTDDQKLELYDAVKDQIFTDGNQCDEDCFSLITPANCELFNEELDQNKKEQSVRCEKCVNIFGNRSD